jgi:hypothetical protein
VLSTPPRGSKGVNEQQAVSARISQAAGAIWFAKKIWAHVSTKHKATVVRHRKKTQNPRPHAESSSAYCPSSSSTSSWSPNTPQSFRHMISWIVSLVMRFRFLVTNSEASEKTCSEGTLVAGIWRKSRACPLPVSA